MKIKQDEVFGLDKKKDVLQTTTKFDGFDLVEAVYADDVDTVCYAYVVAPYKNVLFSTLDNGEGKINVVELDEENYLLCSAKHAMILRIVDDKPYILASVVADKPCEMYKAGKFLVDNGLIVLTDYLPDEKRNLQYLFNFKDGKVISSGYDTIDIVNKKIHASYGLADGFLDKDGNFILNGDDEEVKKCSFWKRLFRKEDKVVGRFLR